MLSQMQRGYATLLYWLLQITNDFVFTLTSISKIGDLDYYSNKLLFSSPYILENTLAKLCSGKY